MHKRVGTGICRLLLMALATSLAACATTSQPMAVDCPLVAAPPKLTEPIPSRSYSVSVQELLQIWREKLTGMPATR